MEMVWFVFKIITAIVFFYLILSAIYIFIFSIAGLFYRQRSSASLPERKFVVLIPGYREDAVILDVASDALRQHYSRENYDVVVIADSFLQKTLDKLKKMPLKLIEVSFEKSTKSKALNKAMEVLPDDYDFAVILDADNVMEEDFLKKINAEFDDEVSIIQGHRMAKNLNTNFAVMDAISEEINNHIFRKGHRVLNLSAALIGSAMVFRYSLFKDYMKRIQAIGGFDKELELNLLRDKLKIEYHNTARVYDEKVSHSDNFKGQRKRWLAAQFIYFARFAGSGVNHLFLKGNIDFFDKVLQMILVPRILLSGLLLLINILLGLIYLLSPESRLLNEVFPSPGMWLIALLITVFAMGISIPSYLYNLKTLKAILSLPRGFLLMFLTILNLRGANKKFIHTKHSTKK